MPSSWVCPYCGRAATIQKIDMHSSRSICEIEGMADGPRGFIVHCTVCPHPKCRRLVLRLLMCDTWQRPTVAGPPARELRGIIKTWTLLPSSNAKVFPDYVPRPIVVDYEEACAIVEVSPKDAATLARRTLQGMIRDFWGIKSSRLKDEVDALEEKVTPEVWEAIDAVRSVGNIGAHMEQDINLIVPVEPGEAEKLIGLVETLVEEWYVARHNRQQRLVELKELAASKQAARKRTPSETAELEP